MKKFTQLFIFLITSTFFGQQKEYKIFNSEVNSKYAELGVIFLDSETVFFASSKKIENDKAFAFHRRAKNRNLFLEFYFGKLTDSSDIVQTNRLSSDVFATFNETDLAISPDRKTIYFSEIKKNTRRYAKRQLTWFRKDLNILWFNYESSIEEIISEINKKIFNKIGGYNTKFDRQDGYYLWLVFLLNKYRVSHCNKPLFFYRKHNKSLSKNLIKILTDYAYVRPEAPDK